MNKEEAIKELKSLSPSEKAIQVVLDELFKLQARVDRLTVKLEKKDKIIDAMAEYLADIDFDECCAEIPEPCLSCSWEDYEPHTNCIKQYFEKKAGE